MSIYNSIPSAPDNWLLCVYKQTFINPGHRHHNKTYIGYHKDYREVLDGTYPTSGKITKPLMKKYGIDYFETEILALFCDDVAMKNYEAEMVTFDDIYPQNPMSLNLKEGGDGFSSKDVKGIKHPMYGTSRFGEENPFYGKNHSQETKQKLRELRKGTKQSKKTKQKISIAISGKNHPLYGKGHLRLGKNGPNYNQNVSTHFIIKIIKQNTIKINSKLNVQLWRKIAKENNLIQNFICRMPEINQILNSNCKSMTDVFKHIANAYK